MGSKVETLEDLLRPGLRAICVGINPSLASVQAGHYYQGRLGRLFFSRIIQAGLVPASTESFMDDVAFESGIGFTDIIKRPTKSSKELRVDEFDHGRNLLFRKLETARPRLVVFTFKATAERLFGAFAGNGFINETIGKSTVFVMPGPYESASTASSTLLDLKNLLT